MHANDDNRPDLPEAGPIARAFGSSVEDLDMDFAALPRPVLASELLRRCLQRCATESDAGEEILSWTLLKRSQALIAVALVSGDGRLRRGTQCPETECGERVELDIELAVFLNRAGTRDFDWSPEPARMLRVALPTGEDQKTWLKWGQAEPRAMARQLVRSVDGRPPVDGWEVPDAWIDGLEAELKQRDPLTALELEARCPACGAPLKVEFDLETELLKRFEVRQARMLRHVHRLASAYHWSEAQILRLPAWRRNYYLSQLEEER